MIERIIMRHGQAAHGMADEKRPLTPRGRREADDVAHQLKARLGERSVVIVTSPAVRTQETSAIVAPVLGAQVHTAQAVYSGSEEQILLEMELVSDEADVVMLIGHEPVISYLATLGGFPKWGCVTAEAIAFDTDAPEGAWDIRPRAGL